LVDEVPYDEYDGCGYTYDDSNGQWYEGTDHYVKNIYFCEGCNEKWEGDSRLIDNTPRGGP